MDHPKILDAGKTKFACGCWIEMNYQRTFPVVNGDVCDRHLNSPKVEVDTPVAYKVFWLFLRNQLRKTCISHEPPYVQQKKDYPNDVITDHDATFDALDSILNIDTFEIKDFE